MRTWLHSKERGKAAQNGPFLKRSVRLRIGTSGAFALLVDLAEEGLVELEFLFIHSAHSSFSLLLIHLLL